MNRSNTLNHGFVWGVFIFRGKGFMGKSSDWGYPGYPGERMSDTIPTIRQITYSDG
jgi:hypothetical protein